MDRGKGYIAVATGTIDLWIFTVQKKYSHTSFHRKSKGINHLAFRVPRKVDVDKFYIDYLLPRKIPVLYGGPKLRPEYHRSYYSVYFEDPDRLKLEMMYKSHKV